MDNMQGDMKWYPYTTDIHRKSLVFSMGRGPRPHIPHNILANSTKFNQQYSIFVNIVGTQEPYRPEL